MSSSSETENEYVQLFLEATDTNFLTDAMFKSTPNSPVEKTLLSNKRSQRYLENDDTNYGADFTAPGTVQKHVAKKLSQLIHKEFEFFEGDHKTCSIKAPKSRVVLLSGADCYVKPYEEFEYDMKGPEKKPVIRKRSLPGEINYNEADKLRTAAVSGEFILNGTEVKRWAPKQERREKVFHYHLAEDKTLHAKERITEFTQMRRKNKWNASKIKHT